MTDYKNFLSQYESFEKCRISRGYAIKRLASNKFQSAKITHNRLKRCRSGSRCLSGVCPVCARGYRLRLLKQAEDILGEDQPCIQLSWTLPHAVFAGGMLVDFDLNDLVQRQQMALMEALPDTVALGGIDVSLKVHGHGRANWHVCSRVLIGRPADQDMAGRLCQAHRPRHPYYFSLQIRTVTAKPSALSYAFKHRIFFTRYGAAEPFDDRLTYNPLPRPYAYEADLFQERWPLWDRLILHNVTAGSNPHRPVLRRQT